MTPHVLLFLREFAAVLVSREMWVFVFLDSLSVSRRDRMALCLRFAYISTRVECPHTNAEMIAMARFILSLPAAVSGVMVEAGAYKGGSTIKLSILARMTGRKLFVFDSFRGLPKNQEIHTLLNSRDPRVFFQGEYRGTLSEVKRNIADYGAPEVCEYKRGLFAETMKRFREPVAFVFADVDLVESTRICLEYIYPLLQKRGAWFSHDGHLQAVVDVYKDPVFWKTRVKTRRPKIQGLGVNKLLRIVKR